MKINKQYVLRTLFFLIGLVILFWGLSKIFDPKDNAEGYGMSNISAAGILGEDVNTVDVVFIGDSEAWAGVSPLNVYEKYGITSYNCATPGQQLFYTESILEALLERQHPSVVFLEAEVFFTEQQAADLAEEYLGRVFPLFEYHNRWKSLKLRDFTGERYYSYKDPNKGFNFFKDADPLEEVPDHMADTGQVEPIPLLNRFVIKQIQRICEENNIELVLFRVPNVTDWSYAKYNAVNEYAAQEDLPFIDLNLEFADAMDWKQDTRDKGAHLNYSGALKVTNYLADYMHEHFTLQDHRQDEKFVSWDEALKTFKEINGLD
ncbi:MAG: hypothetical protein J6E46_05925 [Faecalicoccus sp.]|nr:hypothetical protein [Faecalicoccus sp.]